MKAHKLDVVSLVFGVVFSTIGLVFVASASPWRALLVDLQWTWLAPVGLMALGVLVLVPLLKRDQQPAVVEPEPEEMVALDELPPSPML